VRLKHDVRAGRTLWLRRRRYAYAVLLVVALASRVATAQNASPILLQPAAVAYDSIGDLFIADADRNQIFEITLGGTLTTIAGTGVQGFAGDGGAATSAQLNTPRGVAVGADGTVYVADTGNDRIRSIQNGQITTFAGSGTAGFSGDGGAAAAASLNEPGSLAIDSTGALLICDRENQRIRRVSNGVITTVAGDGIQGFSGDGGPATSAELNEPSGIAVGAGAVIFIADTGNGRVRAISSQGMISTFAGTGVNGYGGDGGQATAAQLNHPSGVGIDPLGELLIADQNNQRVRRVGANGIIVSLAGSGTQGVNSDGTVAGAAALNSPGAVTASVFGWPLFSDPANHTLRALMSDGKLYQPAGLVSRTTTLNQTSPGAVYGTAFATLTASSSSAGTPLGTVVWADGGAQVGKATLVQGTSNVPLPTLSAGSHTLTAVYQGDGVHPSATASSTIDVAPAPLIATANDASAIYGAPLPSLTGTLAGVLAQDVGDAEPIFTASAPLLPSVGSYAINAALTGRASANYTISLSSASGSLTVSPAPVNITVSPVAGAYAGLPLELMAQVASTTQGVPTGTVAFLDGGAVVASATLVNGSATAVYLAPSSGSQIFSASYSGDHNFLGGTSAPVAASVAAIPDFNLAVTGSSQQTAVAGSTANYVLAVASQGGPFTGAVTLSASGLPSGASASFAPPVVIPGAGSAAVTMTITTATSETRLERRAWPIALSLALMLPVFFRRRRSPRLLLGCLTLLSLFGLNGCGARTASEAVLPVQSYNVTVKATSTNLAGAVVVHSLNVTLGVE
jgi:sugar lactone lactonase YvrE